MPSKLASLSAAFVILALLAPSLSLNAQTSVKPIQYKTRLLFSPRTQTVAADSEFEASLYLDTLGFSINTVDIRIDFPADKLSVVKPSAGESVVGLWIAAPKYSNSRGTIEFSGVVPGGLKIENGLLDRIVFRAKAPGAAVITVSRISKVLVNDGFASETEIEVIPLRLTIESKSAEGVPVTSETHPFAGEWSNNRNPVFNWAEDSRFEGYSYLLDDKSFTEPDEVLEGAQNQAGFENIKDGVWYFHLKAKRGSVWSNTTHYTIRVDTLPPAQFTPTVDFLLNGGSASGIVSFFTTDALSGVAGYEVGVLRAGEESETIPAFLPSESPYYLPRGSSNLLLTVRAADNAGNVRDITLDVNVPSFLGIIFRNYAPWTVPILIVFALFGIYILALSRRRRARAIRPDDLKLLAEYLSQNVPKALPQSKEVVPKYRSYPSPYIFQNQKDEESPPDRYQTL